MINVLLKMLTEGVLKLPRLNLCFLTEVFPGGIDLNSSTFHISRKTNPILKL